MFKGLGQLAGLFQQLPRIKEEMEKLQHRLGELTAEGDAGAGMVRIRVNGRQEILACSLSDEALQSSDKEMLEELIRAAANQALQKVRQQAMEETTRIAQGLGLPPGMGVPALPG